MTHADSTTATPAKPLAVRAVLFDLDGTLIDTEAQTDRAIAAVALRHGVDGFSLPPAHTRGVRWIEVAKTMRQRAGIDHPADALAGELIDEWMIFVRDAPGLPGATDACIAAAAAGLRLAIVSSSPRSVIDHFAVKLGIADCIPPEARIGADSVHSGKPDPEGFLKAAHALGTSPAECLVFEDSRAGLMAARAAGMRSMFITCCADEIEEKRRLATGMLVDYHRLPPGFWGALRSGTLNIAGHVFS